MWFIIAVFLLHTVYSQEQCSIAVPEKNDKFQLYLKGFRWTTPIDSYFGAKDAVLHGDGVTLTCENGFIRDDLIYSSYNFECCNGRFNQSLLYEDLLCKSDFHRDTVTFRVSHVQLGSRLMKCDGPHLEVYQVGARKADGSLKHLYTVCFDKNVMRTKFVYQPPRRESPQPRRGARRDVWGFDFFGVTTRDKVKLSDGYVSRIQKRRLTNAFSSRYNKNKKYPYTFNRGHLAPYSDFVDDEDKRASVLYINAAPQWKKFNGNSWSLVEREARDVVRNDPQCWEIYTGTYGLIPTSRGPLFVSPFYDSNGKFVKGFVPVPKLYWKLVYNLYYKNESRVFVGVNNPELKTPEEFWDKYVICKPQANDQGFLFQGNEFMGFTYECEVDEFLERLGRDEGVVKFGFNT